jgi:murein DD-endopeptidase MepM/ murein hydrolase activator NlpD
MPPPDVFNSTLEGLHWPWAGGQKEGPALIRAALVSLALLIANAASADEMKAPHISVARVDWDQAAASLAGQPAGTPAQAFAKLNAAASRRFPGIGKSPVPVLLPFDIDGFSREIAANLGPPKPADVADRFVRAGFHATRFFLAGPAGYDTAFSMRTADVPELSDISYPEPVYVLFSGFNMLYRLDGPPLPDGTPVKDLENDFPGVRRYLHESYVRYSFQRYGVTYVAAVYCLDMRPRPKILTCRQADRIAEHFLHALTLVGGTPLAEPQTVEPVPHDRPKHVASEFTYFSPGFLIPGTGLKKDMGGRADYTVYARLRFPLKEAPDFANSQSFNNWGDCDFTGKSRRNLRQKGTPYFCKVNGRPLVFDESAGANYSYPWRDNFCEHRHFFVGQCPGGEGHQGQDIRPGFCKLFNEGADRCEPYQHEVVAVHDGIILRARKQEAVYLFVNTPNTHVRVRYMHMNPHQLNDDGVVSGKMVREGDVLGKVGNYNEHERGTTYHLHFDMQVPTKVGWVFVNPYMTLVSAYERLIGARGTEIKPGDRVPPLASIPPVIDRGSSAASTAPVPPLPPRPSVRTEEDAAARAKPHKAKSHKAERRKAKAHEARSHKKRHHIRKKARRKHHE